MQQQPIVIGRRQWLSDLSVTQSVQNHPICRDFEMRYRQCGVAYGYYQGEIKCQSYLEDLFECIHGSKRSKRVELMREQRQQQMKKGERGYLPLPRSDLL